jgi:hypothetical protein
LLLGLQGALATATISPQHSQSPNQNQSPLVDWSAVQQYFLNIAQQRVIYI